MIRTIEKHHDCVIQKVFTPHGKLVTYQAGRLGDASSITQCSTLAEARKAIGVEIQHPTKTTKPKLDNPQNQKGYSAPRR